MCGLAGLEIPAFCASSNVLSQKFDDEVDSPWIVIASEVLHGGHCEGA